MTTAHDLAQAIKSEVERAGERVSFGYSSKHRTAMLDNGHIRHIIFSSTPSFGTAVDKVRADVRTTLRDMHRLREPAQKIGLHRAASMTPVGII